MILPPFARFEDVLILYETRQKSTKEMMRYEIGDGFTFFLMWISKMTCSWSISALSFSPFPEQENLS
jgi:hypothetical protein